MKNSHVTLGQGTSGCLFNWNNIPYYSFDSRNVKNDIKIRKCMYGFDKILCKNA